VTEWTLGTPEKDNYSSKRCKEKKATKRVPPTGISKDFQTSARKRMLRLREGDGEKISCKVKGGGLQGETCGA